MRVYLLSILLFLASCCRQEMWIYREVNSDCLEFNSSVLYHLPQSQFAGIELQFLRGNFGTLAYLNVYCRQIPPLQGDCQSAVAVIVIDEIKYPFKAIRMEGGQRMLLPEEGSELIIEALLRDQSVTIYLDGFVTEISPENFAKKYRKFCRVPIVITHFEITH